MDDVERVKDNYSQFVVLTKYGDAVEGDLSDD